MAIVCAGASKATSEWLTEFLNAFVLFGMSFFSTLAVSDNILLSAYSAGILAGGAFFTRMAIKRGVQPPIKNSGSA